MPGGPDRFYVHYYTKKNVPFYATGNFLLQKNTLSTDQFTVCSKSVSGPVPYLVLYDLTSVRRHLELRAEHFACTAAHEHAL